MDKYITFLYVRRGNAGVRSIRIHRLLSVSVVAVFVALIVTSIAMITRYSGLMMDSHRLAGLQEENERLYARISSFQVEVERLNRSMNSNLELQNQARLLVDLEPISRDVWQVGVGGPEPLHETLDINGLGFFVSGIEKDLSKMLRQSELELQSYKGIIDILNKEKGLRDSTPSIRPLKGGYLSSRFGRRMDPFTGRLGRHLGVDFHARTGTPVVTTADGMVTMAKKKGSFGLVIEVNHGNGFKTRYAHLSKILVKRGQRVKRGEKIGLVGKTGLSTGSHLHYEVIFRKVHRNPLQYIIPEDVYFD